MKKLTGKIFSGAKLTGFELEDETGKKQNVPYDKVISMIKSKEIAEFIMQNIDGVEYIVGSGKNQVANLPYKSMKGLLVFNSRVIEDGKVIGYKVKTENTDEEMVLSKTKVWELAFYDQVIGIRAILKRDSNGKLNKVLIAE